MNYQLLPDVYGTESQSIKGVTDSGRQLLIPKNPDNTDYQKYLDWVAEGNTPEPADSAD